MLDSSKFSLYPKIIGSYVLFPELLEKHFHSWEYFVTLVRVVVVERRNSTSFYIDNLEGKGGSSYRGFTFSCEAWAW